MKKIIAILMAAVMATGALTGCGNSSGSSSAASNSGSGSTAGASSAAAKTKLEMVKESGKLKMVTSPDYAPFEFIDLAKMGQGQEQYVGCDVELGKYIAKELGVELVIEAMDYDAVLTAVNENKCDIAISGITPDDDRKKTMDFSNMIGSEGYQGVLIKKDNAAKFNSIEALNKPEVKLAVQNGSLQQTGAKATFPNATEVIITKMGDGVLELKTGKVDGLVTASGVAAGFIQTYPELMMAEIKLDFGDLGTAVAMPKSEDQSLVNEINKIIEKVAADGLYEQWRTENEAVAKAQQTK